MPRALAICAGLSPRARRARAAASLSGSITVGRPAGLTLSPGGGQAGHSALVDDVPLKLGERGHHRKEELAFTGVNSCRTACR